MKHLFTISNLADVNAVQVARMVLQKDIRPEIPEDTPGPFADLMRRCWDRNPNVRPSFKQILGELEAMRFKRRHH